MRLKDIKASPDAPVYVNMTSPDLVEGAHMFTANMKWDGVRLWKPVHNMYYTRSGWSRNVDVTPDEYNNDRWEMLPNGFIPLDSPEF